MSVECDLRSGIETWHLHSLPGAYSCMCCAQNVCKYTSSLEEWKPHCPTMYLYFIFQYLSIGEAHFLQGEAFKGEGGGEALSSYLYLKIIRTGIWVEVFKHCC